jgi:DNA-binding response OmpR family regulator
VNVPAPVRWGRLAVDLSTYTAEVDGSALEMSARQVELLALFLATPGRVWSRDQLHWVCWGDTSRSRRVDVQLCRLRARLDIDLFRNIRDRGWALRMA